MKHQETDDLNWEQVFDEHRRALLLYARQWTGSFADAEDAVQEGFIKVFRKQEQPKDIVPLLYKAVKWRAIDQIRHHKRRQEREQRLVSQQAEDHALFEPRLDEEERRAEVEEAMKTLNPEQNEVLVMKIWGDLTFQQIARALEIPQGTAASRYRYALEALGKKLKTYNMQNA